MADLVILGNGFDLNVGMKTSYNDYFSEMEREGSVKRLCDEMDGLIESQLDKMKSCKEKYPNVTFWDIIFYILKNAKIKNWTDVENVISEIINIGNQSDWDDYLKGAYCHSLRVYLKKKNNSDYHYTTALNNFCLESMLSKEDMYEYQYGELIKFEQKFAGYINNQDSLSTQDTLNTIKKLFLEIIEDKSKGDVTNNRLKHTSILSFNYTKSIKEAFIGKDKPLYRNFVSIHGQATEDNVIFGIDEMASRDALSEYSEIGTESPRYAFTKTARLMNSPQTTMSNVPEVLTSDTDTIRFYGHSLSQFDYSYFQSIFDFYDIYHTKIVLKFFYSIYCAGKAKEITKTQMSSVIKLLKTYGATMDNKDHGENLLHKLMLEGRLKVIRLPQGLSDVPQPRILFAYSKGISV